ncbi:Lipoamide acyltransferase [Podospora fimiseda]|uniref:Dihydrolipoamide acetyltransferase component of pyruvate dehydrogenase complex n=1 Tax=Podospora fimiseda TaxID=252190 RepID=A0AAN7H4D5_9PEZI|nr:Lipoamide acyltransferase [Podospora fimiseda]
MFLNQTSRAVRQQWRTLTRLTPLQKSPLSPPSLLSSTRAFHATRNLLAIKPVLLADIGEGIVECEIIQWFVEPGARVEEFSPLCEVQSDKASVEITSRFAGVVKKLHYDAGEMAKVGKPFVDIDIEGDAGQSIPPEPVAAKEEPPVVITPRPAHTPAPWSNGVPIMSFPQPNGNTAKNGNGNRNGALATPAVRHLAKELGVNITQINGTGKDGRVQKEDIYKYVEAKKGSSSAQASSPLPTTPSATAVGSPFSPEASSNGPQQETPIVLTRTQEMMFKTMTRSLNIPHFLYADEVDFSSLVELRGRLNKVLGKSGLSDGQVGKLSYLPFIIKAVSMALYKYPILNARVDVDNTGNGNGNGKPTLVLRSQHNIGVAMDTPSGLLVPVVKNVGSLNILGVAAELARLQKAAVEGKLSPQDMSGGTITVSNIGNIGGTYLSPVVVEKEVAILGIGRMRTVPAFSSVPGEEEKIVKKQVCNFSWSADHRVVDGATMARAAEVVRTIVEEPDVMVMHLR